MKIPLSKPWFTEEDIKAVDEVLNSLNERQRKSVEYLKKNKIISRQKYASLFGCSARMAYNDLQGMVSKNILQRKEKENILIMNYLNVQLVCNFRATTCNKRRLK